MTAEEDYLVIDRKEEQQGHTGLGDHPKQVWIQAKHIMELVAHVHAQLGDILCR